MTKNSSKLNGKKLLFICLVATLIMVATIAVVIAVTQGGLTSGSTERPPHTEVLEEGFDIETPYVTLSYPLKWKDKVSVKHIDSPVYTVEFYLSANNAEDELHLFDIAFGGNEGDSFGYLDTDSGRIDTRVISYEIGDSVNASDLELIGDMLEDVNHLILSLESNKSFHGI